MAVQSEVEVSNEQSSINTYFISIDQRNSHGYTVLRNSNIYSIALTEKLKSHMVKV